jgi:ComF family protein
LAFPTKLLNHANVGARFAVRLAGRGLLDVLLPPNCATCDQPVAVPGQLCRDCFRLTNLVSDPCCSRCGVPFGMASLGGVEMLCPACSLLPPVFGQARAAFRYDQQSRRLILPFKHADRTDLAAALAPQMVRAGVKLLARADLLVPVPLHRRRLFQRRYNQAVLLARAVARLARLPMRPDLLIRTRATESMGDKSAEARAAEVQRAFAVRASRLKQVAGTRVLLIDDVMTSGATANECAAVLLRAGAAAVDVLVAARVPDPRLE